jgi:zinc transport system substrate-binding protein
MRTILRCAPALKQIIVCMVMAAAFFFFLTGTVFAGDLKKPKVIATIFVLYDFCRQIGGDKIALSMLLDPAVEAHSFEPRPKDIVSIAAADVFVYAGDTMEPWVTTLLKGAANKNLRVVDASRGIPLLDESEEEKDVSGVTVTRPGKDPHVWLDLGNAQAMVDTITASFVAVDPANADFFQARCRDYKERLRALDNRFKTELSACRLSTFIYAGHFTFGYFARRYCLLHISPYKGFSPDAEPSPRALAELIKKTRQMKIRYIYYEELIDPKIARVIGQETGAGLLLLASAHNVSKDDFVRGVTFLSIMNDNLEKLKRGLECR